MSDNISLAELGWKPFFQQQLTLEEWETYTPARVTGQQRSEHTVLTADGEISVPVISSMPSMTVGDWVLLKDQQFIRLLDRFSVFSRKAAGHKIEEQLIAVNIDTLFVVTSLNQEFNLNRLERYLSLAKAAGVEVIVVLTKMDLCDDPDSYLQQVQALDSTLVVLALNAKDPQCADPLRPWCKVGDTVVLLGSSGVGKSTLTNTLAGEKIQDTGDIRDDDSKGRHTTTGRTLHPLSTGGLILDTPGIRELQLADAGHGIGETFYEITELLQHCKFNDCQHQSEPGCAIRAALDSKELDNRRWENYQKLMQEQVHNSASMAEKRAKEKKFGKYVKSVQSERKKQRKDYHEDN